MTTALSNSPARQGSGFAAVLGFLFRQWRRHPRALLTVALGMSLATGTDVITPVLAGRLVSTVTQHRSFAHAAWLLGGLAGLGMLALLGRRAGYLGITRLSLRIMSDVASEAFARVQRFSSDWHANSFAGSTVRRLTRGMWAIDMLDDTLLLMLLPELVVLVGTTFVLALRWPLMGAVLGVCAAGFATVSCLLTLRYVAPSASQSNRWDTRVGAALADAITCNPVVKAFGAEAREDRRLAGVLRRWNGRTARTWIRGTNSGNIQMGCLLLLRVVVVGAALLLWRAGRAGAGDIAYVLTLVFLVQGYLRDIGQQVSQLQRAVNEMEELVALFAEPPGVADRKGAAAIAISSGAVRLERIGFRYGAHPTPLFEDLSIDIPAGSRVALVGPSGSGKTTLVKLIQRLHDVQHGRILIDGQDIAGVRQESLRGQIATVPQEPVLFHRSLAENIAYGRPGATDAEIARAAAQANADGFIARLPEGYATLVGERGVKLSGGERQRIAIARAFLADSRILVLDEATSSLDSDSEALVQEAMQRLMRGRTVIVIAHRLSTVIALDRILVFAQGRLVEDGSHAALLRHPDGLYRRLFDRQALGLAAE